MLDTHKKCHSQHYICHMSFIFLIYFLYRRRIFIFFIYNCILSGFFRACLESDKTSSVCFLISYWDKGIKVGSKDFGIMAEVV